MARTHVRLLCILCVMLFVTSLCRAPAWAIPSGEMLVKFGKYVLECVHFSLDAYTANDMYHHFFDAPHPKASIQPYVPTPAPSNGAYIHQRIPTSEELNATGICYAVGRCGVNKDLSKARQLFTTAAAMGNAYAVNNLGVLCIADFVSPLAPREEQVAHSTCIARAEEVAGFTHDGVAFYNLGEAEMSNGVSFTKAVWYFIEALQNNYPEARPAAINGCALVSSDVRLLSNEENSGRVVIMTPDGKITGAAKVAKGENPRLQDDRNTLRLCQNHGLI
jgi:hypothetical protein